MMASSRSFGTALVHPLVLLGISDQITRITAQYAIEPESKPKFAGGVILGRQLESQFELMLSFELNMPERSSDGVPEIDFAHMSVRLEQTKLIFPNYDVLGWYISNSNTRITKEIADLHQRFLNQYPSALLLVFDPTLTGAKDMSSEAGSGGGGSSMSLPISVYETLPPTRVEVSKVLWDGESFDKTEFYVESASDSSIQLEENTAWASRLLPMRISVESGEAERIAVEHVANVSRTTEGIDPSGIVGAIGGIGADSGKASTTKMAVFLSSQRNALEMLHKDIQLLEKYVGEVIAGTAPFDPDVMQLVQRVLSNKPVVKNDDQFDLAMMQEETNYQMASYLAQITGAAASVRSLSQRSNTALLAARTKHAAYVNPNVNMFDGGMSDMMSMFGGHDRFGRHGRAKGFGSFFR
ncbi:COP9 signalosome complex subunit 6 [Coemansia erecta]|uniref:COP9 signalosome complex subunit 6 n=1 Tax=Coemansia erecta TaxID=147472 RepID=A0A9W7Y204_9FUNG|nr:COP9 signalosome complex subunit 6 [Coemansia erecta]